MERHEQEVLPAAAAPALDGGAAEPTGEFAPFPFSAPPPPPRPARRPEAGRRNQRRLWVVPSPEGPEGAASSQETEALRRARRDLHEARDELQALQEMLSELPGIFERKFSQRLDSLLDQQRLLQAENQAMRQHLAALAPGTDPLPPRRRRALLPPAAEGAPVPGPGSLAEAIRRALSLSVGEQPRAASADPTHR